MKPPATRPYLLSAESITITDIVLNLFIFFFVCFSLLATFGLKSLEQLEVTLPRAETGKAVAGGETLVLTITRDGRCHLKNRVVPASRLVEELERLSRGQPRLSILVQADEAAPCKSLVAVFDAGRAAGVSRMNFAVRPKEES